MKKSTDKKNSPLAKFMRYALLVKYLQEGTYTFEKLQEYIEAQGDQYALNLSFERRTFQRYLNEIREVFGIEIVSEREFISKISEQKYFIKERISPFVEELFNALDLSTLLMAKNKLSDFVWMEDKQAIQHKITKTTLNAIREKKLLKVIYRKFGAIDDEVKEVAPLAIREFKGRWFLIAQYPEGEAPFSLGFDRMENVSISPDKKASSEPGFQVREYYKDCFGIFGPREQPAEAVRLWFSSKQANYVKAKPWHHSQYIVEEDKSGLVVEMHLHLTFDLEQEILSMGGSCKVLAPKELQEKVKAHLQRAMAHYS